MAYLAPTDAPIICLNWYVRKNTNQTNGSGICREFELYTETQGSMQSPTQSIAITHNQAVQISQSILSILAIVLAGVLFLKLVNKL